MRALDKLSWGLLGILALTLGLAPFTPEPHIWEKLKLLFAGALVRPIDIFDLLMHGAPWLLLVAKVARTAARRGPGARDGDTGDADTGDADTGHADTGDADTGEADTGEADTGEASKG